jgi:hypothetical protein
VNMKNKKPNHLSHEEIEELRKSLKNLEQE